MSDITNLHRTGLDTVSIRDTPIARRPDLNLVADESLDDDPGWPSLGKILFVLVPGYLQFRMARERDQLVALRAVFLSFSMALVLFAVVLQFIGNARPTHVMPWLAILVGAAVVSVAAVRFLSAKPLDCASESRLATSYRSRFFVTIAFSESVALFAFVFAFIGAPTWIYDAGAAFALVRFSRVEAPTPQRLQQHQAVLAASGCQLSLVGALRRMGA
jgi:F0F1-type ATP synthase membrane subunit c/vacuolar-type H+-ATPase subunit K